MAKRPVDALQMAGLAAIVLGIAAMEIGNLRRADS
jgi:hypothetical protein